ncbi:MAG: polysaccharide biosynthesis protein [Leptospirales bacterium]|nr:polysaccharide biosynthesis protein [Leptospirales bacterium]
MTRREHILIVGAGEAGRSLLEEFRARGRLIEVSGFVDDDPAKQGLDFHGKKVLGFSSSIPDLIASHRVKSIIIAMPSVSHSAINKIMQIIMGHPEISIHILPEGEKYFDSMPLIPALEDISVSALLERDEYSVDVDAIHGRFSESTVLVTGAGGSIGSEICRQLLKFNVRRIIALGRGEYSIYTLIKSMNLYVPFMKKKPEIFYRIADVKNFHMIDSLMREFKPDIVFHAAAHKHVPLMEYNELEAFMNNVSGTRNVLEAASLNKVSHFIFISTDKAVRPTSVMGATKRLCEMITSQYCVQGGLKTASVRFGNVIGSRGSVIPLFLEQIKNGGPVTVTHPDVGRYFMSINEASLLVINAAAVSAGGEIFVLDMGKQHNLAGIARRLIEAHGLVPDEDIKIEYSGLRPGEKLSEEIFHDDKDLVKTSNNKIFMKKESAVPDEVQKFLREYQSPPVGFSNADVRSLLKKLVADYTESPRADEFNGRYIS